LPTSLRPAVAYIRVSTAEQASSGLGLDAQRATIAAACQQHRLQLVDTFEDAGVSSTARRRPGLEFALEAVHTRRAHVLITAKLDRLARSTFQAASLFAEAKQNGWELIIADIDASTAGGRFMRNVMAAAAEYEHELISLRTRDALAAAKARGIRVGRPLEVRPELVEAIVSARRRRRLSARAIARELEASGTLSPRGSTSWHASTVADILHRADCRLTRGRPRRNKAQRPS
jgi:DNA invertase Pin-like site-specific DNA recombinase